MPPTALILGPTGRMGRHAALAFEAAGWRVRRFKRGTDLNRAAQGADVIVNAWNPPYHRWQAELPGLTAAVIASAKVSGATVIIPGNIYVFGPGMPPVIGPDTPHLATHPLGQLRRKMEAQYRAAGIRTILLRAGDYLDDRPSGNWFDLILAKKVAQGRLTYPGRPDRAHAWAWLPDVAAAMVGLAEQREALPGFSDLAFPGYTLSGQALAAACAQALGRPVTIKKMRWLPIQVARPFWAEAKHLIEMRYLWNRPHALDGTALDALLPERQETPLIPALRAALQVDVEPDQPVTRRAVAV